MHATLFINYFEHFSQIILFLKLRYAIATQLSKTNLLVTTPWIKLKVYLETFAVI